jgi:hypothetical protein
MKPMAEAIADAFVEIGAKITKFQAGMDKVRDRMKVIGAKLARFGKLAAGAVAAGFAAMAVAGVKAFAEQEAAVSKLSAALEANGDDVASLLPQYQDLASDIQAVTTQGDEMTLMLMAQLRNLGVMPDRMEAATKGTIGLQKALGVGAEAAAKMTAMAEQGEFTLLNRYVPALRGASTDAEKMAIVQDLMAKGFSQAEAETKTVSGAFQQLKNDFGDVLEQIGQTIVESAGLQAILVKLAEKVRAFGNRLKELREERFFDKMILQSKLFFENVKTIFKQIGAVIVLPFQTLWETVKFVYESIGTQTYNIVNSFVMLWKNGMNKVKAMFKALWHKVTHPSEPFEMPDTKPMLAGIKAAWVDNPDSPKNTWKIMLEKMEQATAQSNEKQQKLIQEFNAKGAEAAKKAVAEVAKVQEQLGEVGEKAKEAGKTFSAGFSFELPHLTDTQIGKWEKFLKLLADKSASVNIDIKLPSITTRLVDLWGKFFQNIANTFSITSQGGAAKVDIGVDISLPTMTNTKVKIWADFFDILGKFKDLSIKIDVKLPKLTNKQVGLWEKFFKAAGGLNIDLDKLPAAAKKAAEAAKQEKDAFNKDVVRLLEKAVTQRDAIKTAIENIATADAVPVFGP